MGGLFGSSNAKQPTAVGSLQFQTAQQGGVIPLVYGTARVSPNLIAYDDFKATAASGSGKGKGGGAGKGGATQYDYSASIVFGLCQGPVAETADVWWDKNIDRTLSGFDPAAAFYAGADGQAGDPYWQTNHPNEYVGYSGTAYVVANNHALGTTATVPNVSFEVQSLFHDAPNGADANPATIVADYLTNPRYGAGFPAANLDPGMTAAGDPGSYWSYCQAAGLFLSPQLDQQQEAQQHLGETAGLSNSAVVWSGGLLKVIPYGDEPLLAGYTNATLSPVVVAAGATASLTFTNPLLPGSPRTLSYTAVSGDSANEMAKWLAVFVNADPVLAAFGIRASAWQADVTILEQPPQGTAIAGGGSLSVTVAPSVSYAFAPVTAVRYRLGEDDFIVQATTVGTQLGAQPGGHALRSGGAPVTGGFTDDPVHVGRTSPADADNFVRLEFRDRAAQYNSAICEVFDQAAIDLYGVRVDTSLKATAVASYATAVIVAQLALQRRLYFRNLYSFRLGWKYCLLEPMDLVEISDPRLGIENLAVRITQIEEDAEGTLAITAEDFQPGWATAGFVPQNSGQGFVPNWSVAPGDVNTPVIFEPPAALLSGDLEIWVALSGGANWGGAQVWISSDGSSYAYAGSVDQPATMGVSTADLPNYAGANPDTTDTLALDLSESRGQLQSVSAADAANLVTLSWLGGELLAYQTATLVGTYAYNLTTLYRGAEGSNVADHPAGAQYARLDAAIGRFPYPKSLIGQEIYLKFLSFNIVGNATQALADVTAYTYTVTGDSKPTGNLAVSGFYNGPTNGSPPTGTILQRYVFATTATFGAGLPGSKGNCAAAAATVGVVVSMTRNGTGIGTMTFNAGSLTATFTFTAAVTFVPGDVLELFTGSQDSSFAYPSWTLLANA